MSDTALKLETDKWLFGKTTNWSDRNLFLTTNFTNGFNASTCKHYGYQTDKFESEININKLLKRFFRILERKCFKRQNTTQIRRKNRIKRLVVIHRNTQKKHAHIIINTPTHLSKLKFYFYVLNSLLESNLIQDYEVLDVKNLVFKTKKAVNYFNKHKSTGFCAYKLKEWDNDKKLIAYLNKETWKTTNSIDLNNSYL